MSPIKEMKKDAADFFHDVLGSVGRSENGVKVKKHLRRHPSEQSIGGTWAPPEAKIKEPHYTYF